MKLDASTQVRILDAAQNIFLEKGLEGARMQDIADAAGINKAMLHYYFRSKDKLFETILINVLAGFLPKIFSILNEPRPLFDKIELFCSAYIEQELATPYVPFFIIREMNRDPKTFLKKVLKGKKPPLDIILKQVQDEIKKGTIKKTDPFQLLLNIISLCIFPFLARPMIQLMSGMNLKQFSEVMEKRKKLLPEMIINYIKV